MVQRVLSVAGQVEVGKAVVIVIADRDADPVVAIASIGQACFFGYVGEAAVWVLAIQAIPVLGVAAVEGFGRMHRICEVTAIDQEDVKQAVVVVVEERDAAAHGLDQIFLGRGGIYVPEIQAGRVFDIKGRRGRRRRRNLREMERKNQAHGRKRFQQIAP